MRFLPLLFALILTACVAAGPGKNERPLVAENPITGSPIAVTTLDGPTPGQSPVSRPKPKPTAFVANPDPAQPAAGETAPKSAPPSADLNLAVEGPIAPPRVMSPAEKTCVNQGGRWGPAGKAGETCIKLTKDSGKQCNAQSDCEGYCLSRSRTCAPFTPMFGCNDILQDNGVQVTLCID